MAVPRPQVPTLAELRQRTPWLWLNCAAGCGHHRPIALAPFIIRYGAAAENDFEIDIRVLSILLPGAAGQLIPF